MALEAAAHDGTAKTSQNILAEEPARFEESLFRGGGKDLDSPEDRKTNSSSTSSAESNCSSNFLLTPVIRPTPTEIRRWMTETQETISRIVTDWQQDLVHNSHILSNSLEELVRFISNLDKDSLSPSVLTGKLRNNTGSFESTVNIYLQVIILAVNKITRIATTRKSKKRTMTSGERQHILKILSEFTYLAEDALKFLHSHEKYLVPVYSRIISMRNDLYEPLRRVNTEPLRQIIPFLNGVSLEKIRRKEDAAWVDRVYQEHLARQKEEYASYLEVKVGARDYSFLVKNPESVTEEEDEDTTILERLDFVEVLVKQLSACVGSSSQNCKEHHKVIFQLCTHLWKNFHLFYRTLELERRKLRLKPENCCDRLKSSLCELEVKFHQVEKVLEEIPEHLRRIVGVCDQCCKQLITGLGEEAHDLFEQWSSPVENVSEEYFKSRRNFFQGCLPVIWGIILRVFLKLSGNGNGDDDPLTDSKLKDFWRLVATEMEELQTEMKAKELESDYSIILNVPMSLSREVGNTVRHSHRLNKYTQ